MAAADLSRCLQWCNGGHYFPLSEIYCARSGFADGFVTERLRRWLATANRYEELIAAGVEEADLLRLIIAPESSDPHALVTLCGDAASLHLAELICSRNELILAAFPRGTLRAALEPNEVLSWYARSARKDHWLLVDSRYLIRWIGMLPTPPAEDATSTILQHLASRLGASVEEVIQASQGREVRGVEVAQMLVCADHPPIAMDAGLHAASTREHDFIRSRFPTLPLGHLNFLPLLERAPVADITECRDR